MNMTELLTKATEVANNIIKNDVENKLTEESLTCYIKEQLILNVPTMTPTIAGAVAKEAVNII